MHSPAPSYPEDTAFLDSYVKMLQQRQDSLRRKILPGAVHDFAEYKALAGEYNGLTFAIDALRDTVRTYMEQD